MTTMRWKGRHFENAMRHEHDRTLRLDQISSRSFESLLRVIFVEGCKRLVHQE